MLQLQLWTELQRYICIANYNGLSLIEQNIILLLIVLYLKKCRALSSQPSLASGSQIVQPQEMAYQVLPISYKNGKIKKS